MSSQDDAARLRCIAGELELLGDHERADHIRSIAARLAAPPEPDEDSAAVARRDYDPRLRAADHAEALRLIAGWMRSECEGTPLMYDRLVGAADRLAAAPPEPRGVPAEVREAAWRVGSILERDPADGMACADWILSLPQPPAP